MTIKWWTPDFNIVTLAGTKEVCITSYEMCLIETAALKKVFFEYIVIDEAHHIKNIDSILGARDADPSRAIGMFFFSSFSYCTNFF
jgi:hypothetical protein